MEKSSIFLRLTAVSAQGVALLVLFAAIGCGSEKELNTSSSQRGGTGGSTPTPPPGTTFPVSECHYFNGVDAGVSGYISSYYQFGAYVPDKLNMNLLTLPEGVRSGSSFLQFFRWTTSPSSLNQVAVRLHFIDKRVGQPLNSTAADRISKSTMQQMIERNGLGNLGYTVENFIQRVMIVAEGIDAQYVGLQARLTLTQSDQTFGVGTSDFLIPPFYVNPSTFEVYHPAIANLHPFQSYRGSGATDSDFKRMAEDVCAAMVNDVGRLPASAQRAPTGFMAKIKSILGKIQNYLQGLFGP